MIHGKLYSLMDRVEVNYGKVRNNEWKWSREIDSLLDIYKNKLCECGCGNKLTPSRKQVRDSKYRNKPLRVLKGHHNRLPGANWIKRGPEHPFYGKRHTHESLTKMQRSWFPSGDQHPHWKGGIVKPFPFRRGWSQIRNQILNKYGHKCRDCGHKNPSLHVHHIVNRREFRTATEAHKYDNLVPLCRGCHLALENRLRAMLKRDEFGKHPDRVMPS